MVASRKARLQQMANEGDQASRTVLRLLDDPNVFLSTVQIGITLVGVLAGAVGGATLSAGLAGLLARIPLLAPYSEELAIGIVVLTITTLTIWLGELVPKRLAPKRRWEPPPPKLRFATGGRPPDRADPQQVVCVEVESQGRSSGSQAPLGPTLHLGNPHPRSSASPQGGSLPIVPIRNRLSALKSNLRGDRRPPLERAGRPRGKPCCSTGYGVRSDATAVDASEPRGELHFPAAAWLSRRPRRLS